MNIKLLNLALVALLTACPPAKQEAHEDEHGHEGEKNGHGEHGHEEEGHGDEIELSQEAISRAGIRVEPAKKGALVGGLEIPAEVTLDPDRTAHLTPPQRGQVLKVNATLGDKVQKDQVLAELRIAELGEARGAQAQARASLEVARANFARQQELQKSGIGAQREFLEAQADLQKAEADLNAAAERVGIYGGGGEGARSLVKSPLDGTIIQRHASPGEILSGDEPIFVVADLSRVWIVGRVFEQDVAALREKAEVDVRLQAYPDRSWRGTIDFIAGVLDEKTRTLAIRVELPNDDGVLRPGMFGRITLLPEGAGKSVVVPEEAVQRVRDGEVVFVPGDEQGSFRPVKVTTAGRGRGLVAIEQGVAEGAPIVVSGAFTLKSVLLKEELGEGHAH